MNEADEVMERFLKNGLDISSMNFVNDKDKGIFFKMYEEYITEALKDSLSIEFVYGATNSLTIFISGEEIMELDMIDDYQTLFCYTFLTMKDKKLGVLLKYLFFTIKEMYALISKLSETFASLRDQSVARKPRGKRNNLSPNAQKIVNKITQIQQSILEKDDLRKYRIVKNKEK